MLNAPEIIVIGVVTFLFVGAKRMPELAKALGQGIREFKKASSEATEEAVRAINEVPRTKLEDISATPPADKVVEPNFQDKSTETHPAAQKEQNLHHS